MYYILLYIDFKVCQESLRLVSGRVKQNHTGVKPARLEAASFGQLSASLIFGIHIKIKIEGSQTES